MYVIVPFPCVDDILPIFLRFRHSPGNTPREKAIIYTSKVQVLSSLSSLYELFYKTTQHTWWGLGNVRLLFARVSVSGRARWELMTLTGGWDRIGVGGGRVEEGGDSHYQHVLFYFSFSFLFRSRHSHSSVVSSTTRISSSFSGFSLLNFVPYDVTRGGSAVFWITAGACDKRKVLSQAILTKSEHPTLHHYSQL